MTGHEGAPGEWPEVRLIRNPNRSATKRLRFAPHTPAPGYEVMSEHLTETYIPKATVSDLEEKLERLTGALHEEIKTLRHMAPQSVTPAAKMMNGFAEDLDAILAATQKEGS